MLHCSRVLMSAGARRHFHCGRLSDCHPPLPPLCQLAPELSFHLPQDDTRAFPTLLLGLYPPVQHYQQL